MLCTALPMRDIDRLGAHVLQTDGFHVFDGPSNGFGVTCAPRRTRPSCHRQLAHVRDRRARRHADVSKTIDARQITDVGGGLAGVGRRSARIVRRVTSVVRWVAAAAVGLPIALVTSTTRGYERERDNSEKRRVPRRRKHGPTSGGRSIVTSGFEFHRRKLSLSRVSSTCAEPFAPRRYKAPRLCAAREKPTPSFQRRWRVCR
jgi:hypothetical protein